MIANLIWIAYLAVAVVVFVVSAYKVEYYITTHGPEKREERSAFNNRNYTRSFAENRTRSEMYYWRLRCRALNLLALVWPLALLAIPMRAGHNAANNDIKAKKDFEELVAQHTQEMEEWRATNKPEPTLDLDVPVKAAEHVHEAITTFVTDQGRTACHYCYNASEYDAYMHHLSLVRAAQKSEPGPLYHGNSNPTDDKGRILCQECLDAPDYQTYLAHIIALREAEEDSKTKPVILNVDPQGPQGYVDLHKDPKVVQRGPQGHQGASSEPVLARKYG